MLAGLGLTIGVLTGLFGVGGGFLMNPIMIVGLGIPVPISVGSSLCCIIGTGSAGVARHLRMKNVDFVSVLVLGSAGMCGAVLGKNLMDLLQWQLGQDHFSTVMRVLYLVLLLTTAWLVYRGPSEKHQGKSLLQRLPIPPRIRLLGGSLSGVSLPGLLAVGVGIGAMTGLLGIGGGVLFMPILLLVVGLTAHQAVGTSLGAMVLSAVAGTAAHALKGNVNFWIAMTMLVGSSIGVQIGAAICQRINARGLRRSFSIVVLLTALWVAMDLVIRLVCKGL